MGKGGKEIKPKKGVREKVQGGVGSDIERGITGRRREQRGTEGGTGRPNATIVLQPSFL